MTKPVRLVTTAAEVPLDVRPLGEYYDADLGYSVVPTSGGQPRPVIEAVPDASTMSKTSAAPGDDDDDRGREGCY